MQTTLTVEITAGELLALVVDEPCTKVILQVMRNMMEEGEEDSALITVAGKSFSRDDPIELVWSFDLSDERGR